jgi:VanZ family protein
MRTLKLWLPAILWAAVILAASNDSLSSHATAGWFERTFGSPMPFWPHVIVRKSGHFFEYSVLALLAWRANRHLGVVTVFACLVACLDETKQSFTHYRTGSLWDVLLDTCAAFLMTAAFSKWRTRAERDEPAHREPNT